MSGRVSEKEEGDGISLRSMPIPMPERVESVGLGLSSVQESASSIIRDGVGR